MSFGKLVEDYESLRQVISTYAAESAAKMRREGLACSSVLVFLETNRFRDEPQYNPSVRVPLPYATDNTSEIIGAAMAGLSRIFQEGYRYNKGGAMVEGLIPVSQRQTSLLDPYDRDRVAGLMQALDIVNAQYGPGTLRYGSQGFRSAKWQMRQNHLSTDNNRGLMTDHQQTKRICELGQSTHLIRTF
jgi:DNA polymerase V